MPKLTLSPDLPDPKEFKFYDKRIIYSTPAYSIGKTSWCMIVYEQDDCIIKVNPLTRGTARFTSYLFTDPFPPGTNPWRLERDHPRYDHNDGVYAGLPKTLRQIFYAHQQEIEFHLDQDNTGAFIQQGNIQPALL